MGSPVYQSLIPSQKSALDKEVDELCKDSGPVYYVLVLTVDAFCIVVAYKYTGILWPFTSLIMCAITLVIFHDIRYWNAYHRLLSQVNTPEEALDQARSRKRTASLFASPGRKSVVMSDAYRALTAEEQTALSDAADELCRKEEDWKKPRLYVFLAIAIIIGYASGTDYWIVLSIVLFGIAYAVDRHLRYWKQMNSLLNARNVSASENELDG